MRTIEMSYERESKEYISLNSCGIQHFYGKGAHQKREKGRIDYHVLYIGEGACHLIIDGEAVDAPEGSLILFRPGEKQDYAFYESEHSTSYYIHFSGTGCEELLFKLGLSDLKVTSMGKSVAFENKFRRMAREWAIALPFSDAVCSGMLTELFGIAARAIYMRNRGFNEVAEDRIGKICQRIYEDPATATVSGLAKECFLSESRFTHLFGESVGKSPMKYITELRIGKAKELLAETELSVAQISANVGYPDQNYFSRLFKNLTGRSPRDYRKESKR